MRTSTSAVLALVLVLGACAGSSDTPSASGATPTAERTTETPAEPTNEPATAAAPAFVSGGVRCLHVSPEGELLSCEEISAAGTEQPSATENCAMLSGQLERGECPSENVVGRCLAMDGPDLVTLTRVRARPTA
ncbi:MAG: hypothetical protein M3Y87_15485 [Myxococcota bacterium]|nr:hypothetical protein [Myxococcota bacterium]